MSYCACISSSSPWQIPHVLAALERERPRSVLDVGCGEGKYGLLSREYGGAVEVDGMDAKPGRAARAAYDRLFTVDFARPWLIPNGKWDMALVIDVIEHLDKSAGWHLLSELAKRAERVLVASPLGFRKQEITGDEHATHRSGWYPWEFRGRFPVAYWRIYPGHYSRYLGLPRLWQFLAMVRT